MFQVWNWGAAGVLLFQLLHQTEWETVRQKGGLTVTASLNQNWQKAWKQRLTKIVEILHRKRAHEQKSKEQEQNLWIFS